MCMCAFARLRVRARLRLRVCVCLSSCSCRPLGGPLTDRVPPLLPSRAHRYNIQRFKEALSFVGSFWSWFRDLKAWRRPW